MGARMVAEMEGKSNPMGADSLFLTLGTVGLLRRLLLVVLVGLVAGGSSQWALQDLEDLLILDLLVRFEFGQIGGGGRCQTGDTVLGDSCRLLVFCFNGRKEKAKKPYQESSTDGRPERCQRHRRARTAARHLHGHTRQHQPWRTSHRRAGAN